MIARNGAAWQSHYARRLERSASAMPRMLVAIELAQSVPRHVVIAGSPDAADTRRMIEAFDSRLRPHDLLLVAGGGEAQHALAELAPFVAPFAPRQGRATADYRGFLWLPTSDPEELTAQLEGVEPHTAAKGPER
jgi:uncharacterized protein YyaL (SSP411 family)